VCMAPAQSQANVLPTNCWNVCFIVWLCVPPVRQEGEVTTSAGSRTEPGPLVTTRLMSRLPGLRPRRARAVEVQCEGLVSDRARPKRIDGC
jgi:hypothetical protein